MQLRHSLKIILLVMALFTAPAAEYAIRWQSNSVQATGLSAPSNTNWSQLFSIYADQGSLIADINIPPIAGSYTFANGALTFTPQFPFQSGINYRAILRINEKTISSTHRIASPPLESTTTVAAIHPSADELPENLLKFYLLFSAPMSS